MGKFLSADISTHSQQYIEWNCFHKYIEWNCFNNKDKFTNVVVPYPGIVRTEAPTLQSARAKVKSAINVGKFKSIPTLGILAYTILLRFQYS